MVNFKENISGANLPLRANHANFNLGHWINIQGGGAQVVGREICKSVITQPKGGWLIVKLSIPRAFWMLIQWPKLKFARFAQKDCYAPDIFPILKPFTSSRWIPCGGMHLRQRKTVRQVEYLPIFHFSVVDWSSCSDIWRCNNVYSPFQTFQQPESRQCVFLTKIGFQLPRHETHAASRKCVLNLRSSDQG